MGGAGLGIFVSTTNMCLFVHSQNSTWELTARANSAAPLHVGQVGSGGGGFSILPFYAHPARTPLAPDSIDALAPHAILTTG